MPELGGKDDLNITSALNIHDALDGGPSKEDAISHTVPAKYHGTRADQQDMVVLGKKQVLRVCRLGCTASCGTETDTICSATFAL